MPSAAAPLTCPGHSRPVVGLEFSQQTADGLFLISACHDKTAMLRSGETGDWIGTFEGHKGAVWWAELNASATRAVTCSADFTAKIWDAITGDELCELKHKHIVRAADWSVDARQVMTGGKEAKVRLFDLAKLEAEPRIFTGHSAFVKVVKASGEHCVLSGGDDKVLCLWDTRTLDEGHRLTFDGSVNNVELSADGRMMTVAAGNEVSFWETGGYACVKRFALETINANGYGVNTATLHPEQKAFVAAGGNFWVYVHDFETGAELQCNKGHHGPVYAVRFTPDGKRYASGGDDGTIRIWNFDADAEAAEGALAAVAPAEAAAAEVPAAAAPSEAPAAE